MAMKALETFAAVNQVGADLLEPQLYKSSPGSTLGVFYPNLPYTLPPDWDENQKAPLQLGALKALAYPFYRQLNRSHQVWLKNQLILNGTNGQGALGTDYFQDANLDYYPWNPAENDNDAVNKAPATIGQLKFIFSIDLNAATFLSATTVPNPNGDDDNDGLSNLLESWFGTDPQNPDSDDDGFSDGEEASSGSDPNDVNSHTGYRIDLTYPTDKPAFFHTQPDSDPVYRISYHLDEQFEIMGSTYYIAESNVGILHLGSASWPIALYGANSSYEQGENPVNHSPIPVDVQIFRSDSTLLVPRKLIDLKTRQRLPQFGGDIFDAEAHDFEMLAGNDHSWLTTINNDPLHGDSAGNWTLLCPLVVDVSPNLRDEDDVEIVASNKPNKIIPESTEMVERDPGATPPLPDASVVRISWRDMKVKIGSEFDGKTVTWSMEPLFVPPVTTQNPNPVPVFRGKWRAAADVDHRHGFSASDNYVDSSNGDFDFTRSGIPPLGGTGPDANVILGAETTVDSAGYTAIRVNQPPIGFNKVRITISIEDVVYPNNLPVPIDLIDLEVPAVIVVDPGHGGQIADSHPTSSWNNATSATGVLEKEMTLTLGLDLEESLITKIKNEGYKARVLLTRIEDINPTGPERSNLAGFNGADVFLSLHFNGGPPSVTAVGPEMWIYPAGPPPQPYTSAYQANHQINFGADNDFARRVLDATVLVTGQPERGEGVKGYKFNPVTKYASTPSNLYQDINTYLRNVAVAGVDTQYLPLSRGALLEAGYITNTTIDTWFNGANGVENNKNLADGLAGAIVEDIEMQPQP